MREIKFRGLSNGEWVYGFLTHGYGTGSTLIAHSSGWMPSHGDPDGGDYTVMTPVDPESVGQFTGLTDKNGNDIYEGDIVFWRENIETVRFDDGFYQTETSCLDSIMEVIGNIHENPELLEQSDEN